MERAGFFHGNILLVAGCGLAPALALTTRFGYGLLLGLVAWGLLLFLSLLFSSFREYLRNRGMQLAVFFIVGGTTVSLMELGFRAWAPEVLRVLGLYLPVLVVGSLVWGYGVAYGLSYRPKRTFRMAMRVGGGYAAAVVVMAFVRELLGYGALSLVPFADAALVVPGLGDLPLRAAVAPAGAFFVFGYLAALVRLAGRDGDAR